MWTAVSQALFKHFDVGNKDLYAVTLYNEVMIREGITWETDSSDSNLIGTAWKEIPGE
jgi:hypothetical protein